MFKVGDKVRVLPDQSVNNLGIFNIKEGEIYTIAAVYRKLVCLLGMEFIDYGEWRFKLVEENMTLEQLVKQANDGWEASFKLREYKDQLEWMPGDGEKWKDWAVGSIVQPSKCRIKPKPSFGPFTVGNNWLVKLEGDIVHVGCNKFNAKEILNMLKEFNNNTITRYIGTTIGDVSAKRNGLLYNQNSISWEDSEKIVAALEKAGVK